MQERVSSLRLSKRFLAFLALGREARWPWRVLFKAAHSGLAAWRLRLLDLTRGTGAAGLATAC